jgi:hypothetical protein
MGHNTLGTKSQNKEEKKTVQKNQEKLTAAKKNEKSKGNANT